MVMFFNTPYFMMLVIGSVNVLFVLIFDLIAHAIDNDNKGVISQDIDDFMDSLSGKPLDESLKKYSDKLKADGMDEYLSSARKQWEEFHK